MLGNKQKGRKDRSELTRFKPGNTEHLKRRKKTPPNNGKLFRQMMAEAVPILKNGRRCFESRLGILIDELFAGALKGNSSDAADILLLYENFEDKGDMQPLILQMSYADSGDLKV